MNPMSQAAQKLLDEALQLADHERVDLAADFAWNTEIHRRLEDLDSGSVKPIPWPDARRMILE